jgi:hypothetical protein
MTFHKSIQSSVGADLSRPSPMYRPSLNVPYQDFKGENAHDDN